MSTGELKKDLDELPKKYKEAMDQLKALRVDFIISHLEGPAKEEAQMYKKKDRSNPDFLLDVLTQAFGEKRSSSQFLKLFYGQKHTRIPQMNYSRMPQRQIQRQSLTQRRLCETVLLTM